LAQKLQEADLNLSGEALRWSKEL